MTLEQSDTVIAILIIAILAVLVAVAWLHWFDSERMDR